MKHSIKMASVLVLAALLTACQSEESDTTETTAKSAVIIKTVPLLSPGSNDFIVNDLTIATLPGVNQMRDSVSFVQPVGGSVKLLAPALRQQDSSDQYWRTVSGAELNAGINLARSASMIHSLSDPQAMATAGIIDDSSALTLSKQASAGQYRLQVVQALGANDSYLINVKEKGSAYKLRLEAPVAQSSSNDKLQFSLAVTNSEVALQPKATLKHSDGQYHQLALVKVDQQWQAKLPQGLSQPSSNRGLSEIQIDIETRIDNKPVIRTVKTAFKQYVPSASWGESAQVYWRQSLPVKAVFSINAANAGRYELSAVLVGTDAAGVQRNIVRTQSALWLDSDGLITLDFDERIVNASGLGAPFTLKALELKDQGQMARLGYLEHAAEL